MSRFQTVAQGRLRDVGGTSGTARAAADALRRALAMWPLLLIVLGGLFTALWAGILAWLMFRLAGRLL